MNTRKLLFLIFFLQCMTISAFALSKSDSFNQIKKDTIEFSLRWDFIGDCGNDCYKFLGTDVILKINGKSIGSNCHHIFIKCPSDIKLYKSRIYKFVAILFSPNECSTNIDLCTSSKNFLLLEEVD